ncbi:hypothetical protein ACFX13_032099 [Malus domestica]
MGVRLADIHLFQTLRKAGALCTGYDLMTLLVTLGYGRQRNHEVAKGMFFSHEQRVKVALKIPGLCITIPRRSRLSPMSKILLMVSSPFIHGSVGTHFFAFHTPFKHTTSLFYDDSWETSFLPISLSSP